MNAIPLPAFLPGRLLIGHGTPKDYSALERFHYRAKRPATWAGVWVVHYEEPFTGGPPVPPETARVVAVAVLSYPTVNSAARDRVLGIGRWAAARKLAWVNRHVRTISRVVVHPQFRGVGLASRLVRVVCAQCPTRWVEAYAVMGRVHPFFEKGGMNRAAGPGDGPVYYWWDRQFHATRKSSS
ncbi:MAG TPA: GNAT family N-acetyltransferase [Tepidisphaeraceae bacterium]|jgi:GNAT superfamily N-acetyltransferase